MNDVIKTGGVYQFQVKKGGGGQFERLRES